MYKLIILLLLPFLVSAVRVPGPCPKVPPSSLSNLDEVEFNAEVLLSMPFSNESVSHIFKDTSELSLDTNLRLEFKENRLQRIDMCNQQKSSLSGQVIEETEGGSVILNTSVTICDKVVGHTYPIHREEIWLWMVDSIGILWSCVDDEKQENHDAAVLLFVKGDPWVCYSESAAEYVILMERFKLQAAAYLSEAIIEHINWVELSVKGNSHLELFNYNSPRIQCPESQMQCKAKVRTTQSS